MQILFDIGGTKTRIAGARDGALIGEPRVVETPQNFDQAIALFESTAQELAGSEHVETAAGGVRAFDRISGRMRPHPYYNLWSEHDLRGALEKALRCTVLIENDAAVVGLGEAREGAGKGMHIVAYLTISTGVGGARIVDGRIDANALGFEPGQQLIGEHTWESLISGTAVEKKYGRKPYDIGDEGIWDELAKLCAQGLVNTIVHWSPDVVVLGGSMMNEIGIPLAGVQQYLAKFLTVYPKLPELRHAALGDLGGIQGALALLK